MALDGRTPVDKAGVPLRGRDKWLIVIQSAQLQIQSKECLVINPNWKRRVGVRYAFRKIRHSGIRMALSMV
jgi:hypothetical protein